MVEFAFVLRSFAVLLFGIVQFGSDLQQLFT